MKKVTVLLISMFSKAGVLYAENEDPFKVTPSQDMVRASIEKDVSAFDPDTIAAKQFVRIRNRANNYLFHIIQRKAGQNTPSMLQIMLREPTLWFSYSAPLENFLYITVNGIRHDRLELNNIPLEVWKDKESGNAGVTMKMNFDGAKILLRFYMRPNSPVLWGKILPAPDSAEKIETIKVMFQAVPALVVGGQYLEGIYHRQAISPVQTYGMKNELQALSPDDVFFIFQDEEFQPGNYGKYKREIPIPGPCYLTYGVAEVAKGTLDMRNSYLVIVNLDLEPDFKEFNFGIWESAQQYMNADFMAYFKKNYADFKLK